MLPPRRPSRAQATRRASIVCAAKSSEAPSFRRMTHDLDVMAVRIEHERAVVIFVVMRPQSRRPVVAPARGHRRLVERVDLFPVLRAEGDVDRRGIWLSPAEPEV